MKFYLAGPISFQKDDYFERWRKDIQQFLQENGHEALNPLDKYKTPDMERQKIYRMIQANYVKASKYIRKHIINPDINLLEQCDAVIAYIGDYSVGTSAEMMWAYLHGIPVYVVTFLPVERWSSWLVGLSTMIFRSWDDLKVFLLQKKVFKEYVKNGYYKFWKNKGSVGDIAEVGLVVTEVAEALESLRDNNKEKLGEELADIIIRVMNFATRKGINLQNAILQKHAKNMTRGKHHGRRVI